jgi:hypothetical protein
MLEWPTILEAIGLAQTRDRTTGQQALLTCWEQTDPAQHAFRCVLAHYLADVEDSVDDEVAWDTTALAEYAHLRGDDLAGVGIPDAAGLAPSLHLNLGDGFLRQGRGRRAAARGPRGGGRARRRRLRADDPGRAGPAGEPHRQRRVVRRPMSSVRHPGLY